MTSVALPSLTEAIAEALRDLPAKLIARKAKAPVRTVENWKQAHAAPQARHIAAMMSDDELCARFLEAVGRQDLAQSAKTIAALKAALLAEGK